MSDDKQITEDVERPSEVTARKLAEMALAEPGWEALGEYLTSVADYLESRRGGAWVQGIRAGDEILIRRTYSAGTVAESAEPTEAEAPTLPFGTDA